MELDERLKAKVAKYTPSAKALQPIRHTPLLFMVGISGAGKDTVQYALLQKYPNHFYKLVTCTTRAPRENHGVMEQEGVNYHFLDFATANRMLDDQEFVEAQVVHFDNIYGTSIAEIKKAEDQGRVALADIDTQGVAVYMQLGLLAKPVFLLPPSYTVWKERLMSRYAGKVHQHDLYKRMHSALQELEHALQVDYFYIVINDDLDKTVELIDEIARGGDVERHYQKAMTIADDILAQLRAELHS